MAGRERHQLQPRLLVPRACRRPPAGPGHLPNAGVADKPGAQHGHLCAGAVDARPADDQRRRALRLRGVELPRPDHARREHMAAGRERPVHRRREGQRLARPAAPARPGVGCPRRRAHGAQGRRPPLRQAQLHGRRQPPEPRPEQPCDEPDLAGRGIRLHRPSRPGQHRHPVAERVVARPVHPRRRPRAGQPAHQRAQRRADIAQSDPVLRQPHSDHVLRRGLAVRVGQSAGELGDHREHPAAAGGRPVARRRLLPALLDQFLRRGRPEPGRRRLRGLQRGYSARAPGPESGPAAVAHAVRPAAGDHPEAGQHLHRREQLRRPEPELAGLRRHD